MKKNVLLVSVVIAVLFSFGCDDTVKPVETGSIEIRIPADVSEVGSRSASNPEYADIQQFSIEIVGPDNFSKTQTAVKGEVIKIDDLKPGDYGIHVDALGSSNEVILTGSSNVTIIGGETVTAVINLDFPNGSVKVDFTLPLSMTIKNDNTFGLRYCDVEAVYENITANMTWKKLGDYYCYKLVLDENRGDKLGLILPESLLDNDGTIENSGINIYFFKDFYLNQYYQHEVPDPSTGISKPMDILHITDNGDSITVEMEWVPVTAYPQYRWPTTFVLNINKDQIVQEDLLDPQQSEVNSLTLRNAWDDDFTLTGITENLEYEYISWKDSYKYSLAVGTEFNLTFYTHTVLESGRHRIWDTAIKASNDGNEFEMSYWTSEENGIDYVEVIDHGDSLLFYIPGFEADYSYEEDKSQQLLFTLSKDQIVLVE